MIFPFGFAKFEKCVPIVYLRQFLENNISLVIKENSLITKEGFRKSKTV